MELIKESDFRKEIKKSPANGYLFFGEEDYLKQRAVEEARKALVTDPGMAAFNEFRLDAIDFDSQKLLNALMPLPMMTDRKFILITGLDFNAMKASDLDDLCEVLSLLPTYDYNTLILTASADCLNVGVLPKKPSAVYSRLTEFLIPVQFESCSTAKLSTWVGRHFDQHGITATPDLCAFLPEYCGHNMFVLSGEIDKVCFYLLSKGKKTVSVEDIRLVCTPAIEYNVFAFANSILDGKSDEAFRILSDYKLHRMDPILIFSDVVRVVCDLVNVHSLTVDGMTAEDISVLLKMNGYKVSLYQKSLRGIREGKLYQMLSSCADADAAIKLTSDGYPILEKMICSFAQGDHQ